MSNKKLNGPKNMNKSKLLRDTSFFLLSVAVPFVWTPEASATAQILGQASGMGVNVSAGCQTCHTGTAGSESKANLKPGYQAAFTSGGVAALAALINTPTPTPTPTPAPTPTSSVTGSVGKATSGAAKTDVYKVKCGSGTKHLSIAVKDLVPVNPSKVSIQASKGTSSSALSTDKSDGDDTYSRTIKLKKGPGAYLVKVNKSKSATIGAEAYDAQISCQNAAGTDAGTTVKIKQNQ